MVISVICGWQPPFPMCLVITSSHSLCHLPTTQGSCWRVQWHVVLTAMLTVAALVLSPNPLHHRTMKLRDFCYPFQLEKLMLPEVSEVACSEPSGPKEGRRDGNIPDALLHPPTTWTVSLSQANGEQLPKTLRIPLCPAP